MEGIVVDVCAHPKIWWTGAISLFMFQRELAALHA
jgi:hypothetical protein